MSGGRPWTTGEQRKLHELRAQRVPMKVIAHQLGRTEYALHSFLRYVPAQPGKPREWKQVFPRINAWKDAEVEQLRTLFKEGASSQMIAAILGRPAYQVRAKANREGLRFSGGIKGHVEREGHYYRANAIEGSARLLDAIRRAA